MVRIRKITAVSAAAGTLLFAASVSAVSAATLAPASGRPAARVRPAAFRVVSYLGYQVRVPASWHVYRLAADPSRCVLFNQHAVYLGTPGADPRCPVSALGRTEALLVQPLGPMSSLPPGTSVQAGRTTAMPSGTLAAQDAASRVLRLALPTAGVQVTATYGRAQALVRSILAGAKVTPVAPSAASQDAPAAGGGFGPAQDSPASGSPVSPAPTTSPAGSPQPSTTVSPSATTSPAVSPGVTTSPTTSPGASVSPTSPAPTPSPMTSPQPAPSGLTGVTASGLGFDTCTVPSVAAMTDWLASPFRVAGTYLGGDNWACGYGNFTRSWVSQVAAEGWKFIPIWVGPQAPCSTIPGVVVINPSDATAEGRAQAASAVATAAGFGYGKGSPIYFDMEGYDNQISSCTAATLDFLNGWTAGLHAAGYRSGVYSSASSGIADLASQYGRRGVTSPDDIWIADWNGDPVVSDSAVPGRDWASNQRLHQFAGPNVERWGGASVNVDDDFADGAVAGLSSPPGPYVLSQPAAVGVRPGSAAEIKLVIGSTASQAQPGAPVQWQVQVPSGLTVTPDQGSATAAPGQPVTVSLRVAASRSARPARYNLPVTATAAGQSLTRTFELVTVSPHGDVPAPRPVVLYAADPASMAVVAQAARGLAIPWADVTGSYTTAWKDAAGGRTLLLAVGQAALNALYTNPCGWSNPSRAHAGSTPFVALGGPLEDPPGVDYFENSAASTAQAALLTAGLLDYSVTGTLPNQAGMPALPTSPTSACLGSASVRVP